MKITKEIQAVSIQQVSDIDYYNSIDLDIEFHDPWLSHIDFRGTALPDIVSHDPEDSYIDFCNSN